MSEEKTRSHGKWSQPGVPHKGWRCVGDADLGAPNETCEMCEWQEIRYVHYMEHDDYSGQLAVGCDCAAKMEGSYTAAKARETWWKNRANRRRKWLTRRWKMTGHNVYTIKTDGYRITIHEANARWTLTVYKDSTFKKMTLARTFDTLDDAKLAIFDAITKKLAKDREQKRDD